MSNAPRHASRREVLGWGLAAGAAALLSPRLPFAVAKDTTKDKGKKVDDASIPGRGAAKQVILLYLAGGATQFETWAPKKKGTANMGEAEPINTSVSGIEIGSYFPKVAQVMDHVTIVRSVMTREGNHDRGRYLMHTGYIPNPTVQHPGIGSYVAHETGSSDSVLPNFVSIGGSQGAGFLGVEWDPFVVDNPAAPVENLAAPPNIDQRRRDTRLSLLDRLNREFESDRGDEAVAPHRNMFERAKRLMDTGKNRAFDVSEEPDSILKLYGESTFGKGCVVARRLLEAGVKVVEVVQGGWDTHNNEHAAVKALAEGLDPAFAGLVQGPEGPRPARPDARLLLQRVRPHAERRRRRQRRRRARPLPAGLLRRVRGRRHEGRARRRRHRPRRRRRGRAPRGPAGAPRVDLPLDGDRPGQAVLRRSSPHPHRRPVRGQAVQPAPRAVRVGEPTQPAREGASPGGAG